MKLKSLKLENFRQHEDSFVEFSDGITIINGTNGAGKSTILEAISWAIYGTEAARGNKDSIKFNKAKARAKVRVELVFNLDNEVFRVERFLDKAELYLGESQTPIVTTQQEVTKYLTEKLGMTKDEFFNTYFTGQKELNFLGNQKPLERRKFISKVLNYDKIRDVQEQVRVDKNNTSRDIEELKQGIADLNSLKDDKNLILAQLEEIKKKFDSTQKEFNKCADDLSKIEPEWEKSKEIKTKFDKNTQELGFLAEKIEFIEKNTASLQEKSKILEEKSQILGEISKYEAEYKEIDLKIKENEKLQEKDALRQAFLTKIESMEKEITEKQLQQEEVIKSGKEKRLIVDKIPAIKEELSELTKKVQGLETQFASEIKEKDVLISQKNLEIGKINKQLALIVEKGEEGTCPTCERTLKGEFEKVTGNFKNQIKLLEDEIKVLTVSRKELKFNFPEIAELTRKKEEKEKELAQLNEVQGEYKNEQDRYRKLNEEIKTRIEEKLQVEKELSKLPEGFDMEVLRNLREKILPLREKFEQILALKAELADFDRVKQELAATCLLKKETESKKELLQKQIQELNYSEETYNRIEKEFRQVKEIFQELKIELVKIEKEEENLKNDLERIRKIEDLNKEKLKTIKEKEEKLNLLIELDRFYGQFWENLNNQARPEISALAGKFLVDLTDGRYSELELNDKYEICLHDDGEIKPVISGGEEDLVNLCVRLAISQIIAQRSGKTLSLLILDEIFGSLDENRRSNVVNLLRSLTNNFEQVILITHIEDIKDEIDNIITIEYDSEKGCSKIVK